MATADGMPPAWMRPEVAERGVVGGILRDPDLALDDAAGILAGPGDFHDPGYALVYETCLRLRERGQPVEISNVRLAVVQADRVAELGPDPWANLAEAFGETPSGANVRYFAGVVREAASRRRLVHEARSMLADALAPPAESAAEMVGRWEAGLRAAADAAVPAGDEPVALPALLRDYLADLDLRQAGGGAAGLPTGLADLDALLGGMRPGQLIVIGARPATGKTALALAFLAHVSRNCGVPSYFASIEMPRGEIAARLLAMGTGVNLHRITRAKLSSDDFERLAGSTSPSVYGRTMLFVDDSPVVTAARLSAQVRRAVRRHGVGLAAVDYLQLMQAAHAGDGRVQQVGQLARDVKTLARQCGIPVVLLSQLNRQSEGRGDGRPKMSDLRESGEIEQHADAVVLLHVPPGQADDLPSWQVEAIVAKNRNGPVGDVPLVFHRPFVRFTGAVRGFGNPRC